MGLPDRLIVIRGSVNMGVQTERHTGRPVGRVIVDSILFGEF